jgi:uncharacterized protein (TIGR02270 family)
MFDRMTAMAAITRPIVTAVVMQHVEDAASLRQTRSVLLRAPHVELKRLARWDERIAAHLDGALVAGDAGWRMALEALERPTAGVIFLVAWLAIERRDAAAVGRLLSLVPALPDEATRALASAFGWAEPRALRGLTAPMLSSDDPLERWLGVGACAAHRVDPGAMLAAAIDQGEHALLRTQAMYAAAQLGRVDLVPDLLRVLVTCDDAAAQQAAARAAVRLGDRGEGMAALRRLAASSLAAADPALPTPLEDLRTLQLALLAATPQVATRTASQLGAGSLAPDAPPGTLRRAIVAAAWSGDVGFVPWLIALMSHPQAARVAGEAFTTLTGADLALLDLDHKGEAPVVDAGPNDDPDDDNVALDEDESLPWPSPSAVQAWWQRHASSMPMSGTRSLAGAAVDAHACAEVLKTRGQRLRYVAAQLVGLMQPSTPIFNIAAPSARQQKALGLPVRVT